MFIGLDPNTEFIKGSVDLDDRGLIATDMGFQTSMPGVFAAGDVRSGSTKQLASAVGEGAGAAIAIRQYLENKDRQLMTMLAVTVGPPAPNSAALEKVPEPDPAEGSILCETIAVGVDGTDNEIVEGKYGGGPSRAGTG